MVNAVRSILNGLIGAEIFMRSALKIILYTLRCMIFQQAIPRASYAVFEAL